MLHIHKGKGYIYFVGVNLVFKHKLTMAMQYLFYTILYMTYMLYILIKENQGKVRAVNHINKHISSFVFVFAIFFEFHACAINPQANCLTC